MSVAPPGGQGRILIYGPKTDGNLYHRVSHGRRRVAGDQRAGWRDPRTQAFPGAYALRAGRAGRSVRNLCHARVFPLRSPQ